MSEPTPIERAEALIRANPRERAAYDLGYRTGVAEILDDRHRKRETLAAAYLLLAAVESGTLLARGRSIAARVAELDRLDAAHPGVWSQEQVRVERERLIAEIGRLMGGGR